MALASRRVYPGGTNPAAMNPAARWNRSWTPHECVASLRNPPTFAMPDGDNLDPRPLAAAAKAAEVLLVCPECGAPQTAPAFESHLRQAHRLHFFRGALRSYNDALTYLLNLLTADPPDAEASRELTGLMREEHGPRADNILAALLGALLTRVDGDLRDAVVARLADLLVARRQPAPDDGPGRPVKRSRRWLALAVMARVAPPFDAALLQPLRGLLLDRRLPIEAQFAALASLLRSAGPNSPLTDELLRKLVGGLGKARAVDRLRQFEQRFGQTPALEAICDDLEEKMRMNCPRCSTQLRRPAMIRHLWDEHRLILDGRRVRDPWAVIEDWIAEYRFNGDAALLERCRIRGRQLDPEDGLHRVHRALLRAGGHDSDARKDLIAEAANGTPPFARGATPWRRNPRRPRRWRSTSERDGCRPASTSWKRLPEGSGIVWRFAPGTCDLRRPRRLAVLDATRRHAFPGRAASGAGPGACGLARIGPALLVSVAILAATALASIGRSHPLEESRRPAEPTMPTPGRASCRGCTSRISPLGLRIPGRLGAPHPCRRLSTAAGRPADRRPKADRGRDRRQNGGAGPTGCAAPPHGGGRRRFRRRSGPLDRGSARRAALKVGCRSSTRSICCPAGTATGGRPACSSASAFCSATGLLRLAFEVSNLLDAGQTAPALGEVLETGDPAGLLCAAAAVVAATDAAVGPLRPRSHRLRSCRRPRPRGAPGASS